MIPEILGIELPSYITDQAPVVNKLSMLNANSKLKDSLRDRGSMEIVSGTDVVEEEMRWDSNLSSDSNSKLSLLLGLHWALFLLHAELLWPPFVCKRCSYWTQRFRRVTHCFDSIRRFEWFLNVLQLSGIALNTTWITVAIIYVNKACSYWTQRFHPVTRCLDLVWWSNGSIMCCSWVALPWRQLELLLQHLISR